MFVRRTAPRYFMAKNRKHRKIKKHYTVAVTSDYSVSKTKYYRSRINIFSFSIIVMVVVFLMADLNANNSLKRSQDGEDAVDTLVREI